MKLGDATTKRQANPLECGKSIMSEGTSMKELTKIKAKAAGLAVIFST